VRVCVLNASLTKSANIFLPSLSVHLEASDDFVVFFRVDYYYVKFIFFLLVFFCSFFVKLSLLF